MRSYTHITSVADFAQAENASGAVAGDEHAQRWLDGVEDALRWVTAAGTSDEMSALLERRQRAT